MTCDIFPFMFSHIIMNSDLKKKKTEKKKLLQISKGLLNLEGIKSTNHSGKFSPFVLSCLISETIQFPEMNNQPYI